MSFFNVYNQGKKKEYPSEIKCYKCIEPGLKLKFGKRDEMGRITYIDIYTNETHVCKDKYLKTITCKFCGQSGLKWIKSLNTQSRVEMVDKYNKLHNCQNRNVSDYSENWNIFFKKFVFGDPDKTYEENVKIIKENWDRVLGVDESGLTMLERYHRDLPKELKDKYKKEDDNWLRHDFNDFINCKCETCDNRRRNPRERKFEVKKRR